MTETGWTALVGTLVGAVVTIVGVVLKWRGDLARLTVEAKQVDVANTEVAATAADQAADNEATLRKDLFTELRRIRKERDDLASVHTRDIAHLQRRLAAQEAELAAQRDQLRGALEDARAMQRQLITLGQEMSTYRAAMRDLQTREYIYWRYWGEVDKQGNLLYAPEWAQIKAAAERNAPRPIWPQPDALLQQPCEEGPTTDE